MDTKIEPNSDIQKHRLTYRVNYVDIHKLLMYEPSEKREVKEGTRTHIDDPPIKPVLSNKYNLVTHRINQGYHYIGISFGTLLWRYEGKTTISEKWFSLKK